MADFKTWFEQKYIDWLAQRGRRGSIREFSELLDIDQKMVSNWMRGSGKPGPQYADKIAIFLDYDMTVYDLLDMPRPDKELLKFKALWPTMTDKERAEVGKVLEKVEKRNAAESKQQALSNPGAAH
jgi:transcriptional regulator with XRE-family HTH domain